MKQIFFSPNVQIRMHGDEVLNIVTTDKIDYLGYQLQGFESPKVEIYDYRSNRNKGLDLFFKTGNIKPFLNSFCSFAKVRIQKNKDFYVILEDAEDTRSDLVLWMATGIKSSIPAYDYLICELASFNKQFSVFSIYVIPDPELLVELDGLDRRDEHLDFHVPREHIPTEGRQVRRAQY